jgi:hypothetical protein
MRQPSHRDQLRDFVERLLRQRGEPTPIALISEFVLRQPGLAGGMNRHDINTCLHDDPQFRFETVKPAVWKLR